jgi:hypothetical protein
MFNYNSQAYKTVTTESAEEHMPNVPGPMTQSSHPYNEKRTESRGVSMGSMIKHQEEKHEYNESED